MTRYTNSMCDGPIDLDALFEETRPSLVRFLSRLVGEADAEDVAQTAMANAVRSAAAFRGHATPRTWLFQIARNAGRDWIRQRGRAAEPNATEDDAEEIADDSVDASQERQLARAQMSRCVNEFLTRLPESYREVLALSDCEELSDREVAWVLDVTVGAAKVRLHRARTRLKQELERGCTFHRDEHDVLCCDRK